MKLYYAVEYLSGRRTTTGQPNKRTGCYSRAVKTEAFTDKKNRDIWVNAGKVTADMRGNCREAVTKKELRNLSLGMSVKDYAEWLEVISDLPYEVTSEFE